MSDKQQPKSTAPAPESQGMMDMQKLTSLEGELNARSNFQGQQFGRRPFIQGRKSDFQLTEKLDFKKFSLNRDEKVKSWLPHLNEDAHDSLNKEDKEKLESLRDKLKQSNNEAEFATNAMQLASLYENLGFSEEAKRATELSLGIDPEHLRTKGTFDEMERIHPSEVSVVEPHLFPDQLTKSALRKRIKQLAQGRVIVVGDLLIDELLEGKPERISREAPVLILEHVDTMLIPGGAANTAHNVAALGGACHAIGVCGNDEYAQKLAELLESCGISHGLVTDSSRPTTVKTRILSKSHSVMQQLLRLDRISHEPIAHFIESLIADRLKQAASGYNAIILSDYRSGVITDSIIATCREVAGKQNLMVIVDAQDRFDRFSDFHLMTPNQPDTEAYVGFQIETRDDLRRAGHELLRLSGVKSLLITRGGEGMVLFQQDQPMEELPAFNRSEVFDVTGAGDTVVATMALALTTGATPLEAMALGNLAAGIVVRKSGTAVTSAKEMIEHLDNLNLPE